MWLKLIANSLVKWLESQSIKYLWVGLSRWVIKRVRSHQTCKPVTSYCVCRPTAGCDHCPAISNHLKLQTVHWAERRQYTAYTVHRSPNKMVGSVIRNKMILKAEVFRPHITQILGERLSLRFIIVLIVKWNITDITNHSLHCVDSHEARGEASPHSEAPHSSPVVPPNDLPGPQPDLHRGEL